MKVGGGKRPPEQPPIGTKHVRPHKSHQPKLVTGGVRTAKSRTNKAQQLDPSQLGDDLHADDIDSLHKLAAAGETAQQGFSQQQRQQLPVGPKLDKEPDKDAGTLAEPHLHALLASICAQLEELAQEIDFGMNQPKVPGQPIGAAELKRVKTEEQLRDILRQVMSGDFGFKLTTDPNTTLGRLFWQLKGWPRGVPPKRRPTQTAPWTAEEWDAFVAWLNTPPELPPAADLL